MGSWRDLNLKSLEAMGLKISNIDNRERPTGVLHTGDGPKPEFVKIEDTGQILKAQRVFLKPLSTNEAWKGKRLKSNLYKKFEAQSLCELVNDGDLPFGFYTLKLRFGFSSNGSDLDNPVKMVIDILSKKYNFNDNRIMRIVIDRSKVMKGQEFYEFQIEKYTP